MKNLFCLIFSLLSITVIGQNMADYRRHFDYDRSRDLNFRIYNTLDTLDARILNIQYDSGNGAQVTAYLVIPQQKIRQYPALIFLHGAGYNKNQFLSEALDLASESFASLLIDDPTARPLSQRMSYNNYANPVKESMIYNQIIVDIRRGIDLLEQNDKIDRDRIAFIGTDMGACTGAIVSGIENRILTYVLIGCNPCLSCELVNSNDPSIVKIRSSYTSEQLSSYQTTIKNYDVLNYIGSHRNSTIFYQFSSIDPYLTQDKINNLIQNTTEPKAQKNYPILMPEIVNNIKAMKDRKIWLKAHL